jgi:NitT/TauT family transport system permease protein
MIRARLATVVNSVWRPLIFLVVCLVLWWFFTSATGLIRPYLVPSPAAVANEFNHDGLLLLKNSWITSYETILGFVLAVIIGLGCAVAIVYSRTIEQTLYPILLFAQVVPKIAIAPLLVVWLGFGPAPKILVAVLIAFFPVVISSVAGLRSVDTELLDLASTMGASPVRTFMKIRFPAALPQIFAGLKVAVTLAVVGAIVGEFVGANAGLGYLLLIANGQMNSALLFAGLFVMSAIGIVLFAALEIAEAFLVPWHASRRVDVLATS